MHACRTLDSSTGRARARLPQGPMRSPRPRPRHEPSVERGPPVGHRHPAGHQPGDVGRPGQGHTGRGRRRGRAGRAAAGGAGRLAAGAARGRAAAGLRGGPVAAGGPGDGAGVRQPPGCALRGGRQRCPLCPARPPCPCHQPGRAGAGPVAGPARCRRQWPAGHAGRAADAALAGRLPCRRPPRTPHHRAAQPLAHAAVGVLHARQLRGRAGAAGAATWP
jgi:hypothetical protein